MRAVLSLRASSTLIKNESTAEAIGGFLEAVGGVIGCIFLGFYAFDNDTYQKHY
jgi:hypothetical protein